MLAPREGSLVRYQSHQGRGRGLPGKDAKAWQRERLPLLALRVSISLHQQSKGKPSVSRTLPKGEGEKELGALPSILSPARP